MGTTRKTKGRSRNGCKQCRSDRKKCDETRPTCGRCLNRRVVCDFDRPLGVRICNRRRSGMSNNTAEQPHQSPAQSDQDSVGSQSSSWQGVRPLNSNPMGHPMSSMRADVSPDQSSTVAALHSVPSFGSSSDALRKDSMELTPMHANATQTPIDELVALTEGESDPFHTLLKDLFGTGLPDPSMWTSPMATTSMGDFTSHGDSGFVDPMARISEMHASTSHSPTTGVGSNEPDDVRRRFNAPGTDPRTALLGTISEPVLATLSDTDVRLFYHYVDVQAPISIAGGPDCNPLASNYVPIALSNALIGRNEDNAAFQALKACAATHRANLMDSTGTDDSRPFRVIAQICRKTAYSLLVSRVPDLLRTSTLQREQFVGGLCILVSLAVVDGNARLLPGLLDTYFHVIKALDPQSLTASELFFIAAISLYQTVLNFSLVVVLNLPPSVPLVDALPEGLRWRGANLEVIFGVRPKLYQEHIRLYMLIKEYRDAAARGDSVRILNAQLDADELATSLGHDLANDVAAASSAENKTPLERRLLDSAIMHHAALRVLLLRDVFQYPLTDYRIQECIRAALDVLDEVKWGTESGLLVPLIILSTAALPSERNRYRVFMRRLCWKGSAGPRAAMQTLDMVVDDPKQDWREAFTKVGAPILV